jgi:hypothetical protein
LKQIRQYLWRRQVKYHPCCDFDLTITIIW